MLLEKAFGSCKDFLFPENFSNEPKSKIWVGIFICGSILYLKCCVHKRRFNIFIYARYQWNDN